MDHIKEFSRSTRIPENFVNISEVVMAPPSLDKIRKAIIERTYVGIYYDAPDALPGFRLLEIYCLGRGYMNADGPSHKDRHYIRAFVIRDTSKDPELTKITRRRSVSKSKRVPYWRLFRVDGIKSWMPLNKKFSSYREKYNPDDSKIWEIDTSLDYDQFPKGMRPAK
jgi:hypothetical protein